MKFAAPLHMIFIRQTSAAVVLVTLTLSLQCAGMGVVIAWARPKFAPEVLRLGAIPLRHPRDALDGLRSLVCTFLEILLWAGFYRWLCFRSWESAFTSRLPAMTTVGYGDVVLPWTWRTLGPVESIIGVLMLRVVGELPFAVREQASRP